MCRCETWIILHQYKRIDLVKSMRDKNKGIYQFILDLERKKNRERALREKTQREEVLGPTEQPVSPLQDSFDVLEDLRTEHTGIGNHRIEPLTAGIFEIRRKDHDLEIKLGISTVMATCSFISIIVLLQMDALMHQSLYLYGLQVLKGAMPYWITINAALGMFWLTAIAAILFKMHVLTHKSR